MNQYEIAYSVWKIEKIPKPKHKLYTFESEDDFLAASNRGVDHLYDQYELSTHDLIIRSVTLKNARELYDEAVRDYTKNL